MFAFTEEGVAMLATTLRSAVAVQTSIAIMRAFVAMRNYITTTNQVTAELAEIRAKLEFLERNDEENLEAVNDLSEDVRKGISALQLKRELGMGSYSSAWRMLHQIRKAMEKEEYKETFEAIVEIDETYVGGKPRKDNDHSEDNKDKNSENKPKRGRGTSKTPVIGVKERNTSHPTRVRGLKRRSTSAPESAESVAPYTGAWIETYMGTEELI